jgi:CDGSH-type Zn-finger protein
MPDVTIKARENGPLLVTGPFKLTDHLGNTYELTGKDKDSVALCRCGHSSRKPFCDGSHRTCGFVAGETAAPPAPLQ